MKEKKTLTKEETKEKALRLLEFRSHSEHELREKLRAAGGLEEDIDEAVNFCLEYNFLNDRQYAGMRARDLSSLKKFGKRRIKSELYRRGLSEEDIEEALSDIEDDEDELMRLVEKKLRGNFDKKNKGKTIRYFLYRGYELSDIKNAIERLMTDEI
ncbi:MAG: regulatory protein RecX [Clostridia bacterium]|nr:regulatory protein RecX [Clostridia bacterium]